MSLPPPRLTLASTLLACLTLSAMACESLPKVDGGRDTGDGDGDGDSSGDGDAMGDGDNINIGGEPGDGDMTGDGDGDAPLPACGNLYCTEDQHCEEQDGEAECVANTCEELDCADTEECIETSLGAHCEDLSCSRDVECASARYCDESSGTCKDDVCVPGTRSCSETGEPGQTGGSVYICSSNGGSFEEETTCGSAAAFSSACIDHGGGQAGCTCEDDWDCPGFQECEAGTCQGALTAPSCRLEPADLADVLPSQELVWGSDFGGIDQGRLRILDGVAVPLLGEETGAMGEPAPARLSPWHESPQATQVPLVANLDDDTGDGVIDERDVPEILFLTFAAPTTTGNAGVNQPNTNGILRAIHGGGTDADGNSKKGRDYFSVCGTHRYLEGSYVDQDGVDLDTVPSCGNAADLDPASTLAVGDLNYDGIPEIVAFSEQSNADDFFSTQGRIVIYDNTGKRLLRTDLINFQNGVVDPSSVAGNPGISLANVVASSDPEDEMVEIVIGRDLFTLESDAGTWSLTGRYQGGNATGDNFQGPVSCVADLVPGRPGMEIVAGASIYGAPLVDGKLDTTQQTLVLLGSDGDEGGFCAVADVWGGNAAVSPGPANPLDEVPEVIVIRDSELFVYGLEITEPATASDEWAVTLTTLVGGLPLPGSADGGGAPNIDDFDGDGFPEVGTAGAAGYRLFDLQDADPNSCPAWTNFTHDQTTRERSPPDDACSSDADCNDSPDDPTTWIFACNENADVGKGACVCLHNSWERETQDASSRVTGSSVFDFNGDGSAEVIYNDECHFRMYRGMDGGEAFLEPSESRTRIEYPVVADVDNDGNAEIVFATTTESGFCASQGASCTDDEDCPSGTAEKGQRCISGVCQVEDPEETFNAGIEVWGDLSDRWVSARRIWNQYSYHVTNVNESGGIPRVEPDSWAPLGERFYNTYRSQPRSFGSAPDLVIDALQLIAPGSCGSSTNLVIAVQVSNVGDLRVGNVPVGFTGTWDDDDVTEELTDSGGAPLRYTITQTLEPGASVVFQLEYDKNDNSRGTFPDSVTVTVDPTSSGMPDGVARECVENNNEKTADVDAAPALPDLRLVLEDPGDECPPAILGTVYNDSSVDAADVVVRLYGGDPSSGAKVLGDLQIGTVKAGESVDFDTEDEDFDFDGSIPTGAPIRIYGDVDPDDRIAECNESNDRYGPTGPTNCMIIPR